MFNSAFKQFQNLPASPILSAAAKGDAMQGMAVAAKFDVTATSKFNFAANNASAGAGLKAGQDAVNATQEFAADARQQLHGALAEAKESSQANDVGVGSVAAPGASSGFGGMLMGAGITAGLFAVNPLAGAAYGVLDAAKSMWSGPATHMGEINFSVPGQGGRSEFSSPISKGGKKSDSDGVSLSQEDSAWNWGGTPAIPAQQQAPAAAPAPSKLTPMQLAAREITEAVGIEKLEKQLGGLSVAEQNAGKLQGSMNKYVEFHGLGQEMTGLNQKGPAMNDPYYKPAAVAAPSFG